MPLASQTQSHVRFPLTSLLGSAGNVRVLRALAAERVPLSVPQLAQRAGLTPRGVRLVLESLTAQRLVLAHGGGRTQLYALNVSHPFAGAVASLFQEEGARWERLLGALRNALSRRVDEVLAAWLYGSVARGEDTPESDLDVALLVTEPAVTDRVREDLMPVEDEHHVHISLTGLTASELAALPEGDAWWADVVRDARVLKGSAPQTAMNRVRKAVA